VVELVDTPDSKSCERKLVTVQVRPAAPAEILNHPLGWFFACLATFSHRFLLPYEFSTLPESFFNNSD
jgi:hypothetical protein